MSSLSMPCDSHRHAACDAQHGTSEAARPACMRLRQAGVLAGVGHTERPSFVHLVRQAQHPSPVGHCCIVSPVSSPQVSAAAAAVCRAPGDLAATSAAAARAAPSPGQSTGHWAARAAATSPPACPHACTAPNANRVLHAYTLPYHHAGE